MRTANHRAIYIDAIAEGGDQNYVFIPHEEEIPERKFNLSPICAFLLSSAIWYFLIWGATEGWKYVGRR